MGVRGVSLDKGDSVISLAILDRFEATAEERAAYLKWRRAVAGEPARGGRGGAGRRGSMPQERLAAMSAAEQFVLTISENGYGKRTSSFEYRVTGRGGKGIVAMTVNARNGRLVASFPVEDGDEVMLVTDGGQLIRCPVDGIRIAGRGTQGVIVFDTAEARARRLGRAHLRARRRRRRGMRRRRRFRRRATARFAAMEPGRSNGLQADDVGWNRLANSEFAAENGKSRCFARRQG